MISIAGLSTLTSLLGRAGSRGTVTARAWPVTSERPSAALDELLRGRKLAEASARGWDAPRWWWR